MPKSKGIKYDGLCVCCRHHFNWRNELTIRPPCPKCGAMSAETHKDNNKRRVKTNGSELRHLLCTRKFKSHAVEMIERLVNRK